MRREKEGRRRDVIVLESRGAMTAIDVTVTISIKASHAGDT